MSHNKNPYVFELIRNRRATKRMLPDYTIDPEHLRIITESIRWTSMSYGVFNYRIIVVPRGKLREELTKPWAKQPSFINASHVILFIHQKDDKIRNYSVKHSFEISIPETSKEVRKIMTDAVLQNWKMNDVNLTEWSAKQAYIGLGSAMIAAADLEIDSAPYEGFDRNGVEEVLEKHGLIDRQNEKLAMGLGLGKANLDDPYVHFFEKVRLDENEFTTIVKE